MLIPVRSEDSDGKLLFEWDDENNTIEIVHKKEIIKVQLMKNGNHGTYKVLDRRLKPKYIN